MPIRNPDIELVLTSYLETYSNFVRYTSYVNGGGLLVLKKSNMNFKMPRYFTIEEKAQLTTFERGLYDSVWEFYQGLPE